MARKENGSGNINLRADGRYSVSIMKDGKRHTTTCKNKSEANKKLKELKEQVIKNDMSNVKRMTVQTYMDDWLHNIKRNQLKPTSYDRLEQTLKYQVYPSIGRLQINSLKPANVQAMVNDVSETKSYSTAKKAYEAVNACFKLAVIKREVIYNPADGVQLPKNKERQQEDISFYSDEQVQKIVAESTRAFKNGRLVYRYGYLIILLLNTGMRIGETLFLKWDNVNFDKKQIYIRGNVVEVKVRGKNKKSSYEMIEQDMPKTHSGRRTIPLNDNAIEALQQLKDIITDDYRVVSTDSGAICSSRNIYRTLEGILKKCGIEMDDKVHALRHTFATMLFKRGVDVKTVSTILGHADVGVTYNTYIHVIEEQKQQAVDFLNDIF